VKEKALDNHLSIRNKLIHTAVNKKPPAKLH